MASLGWLMIVLSCHAPDVQVTVSFGNVASQISLPCFMSHASIPAEVRAARGLPDDLVRISCGIEDAEDLIAGIWRLHIIFCI